MSKPIETLCKEKGLRMTGQRLVIVAVLDEVLEGKHHPNAEELYERVVKKNPRVSLATIYRSLRLLEEEDILAKIEFGDGVTRYERANRHHHDHLIDVATGEVVEFKNQDIEELQRQVAKKLGYKLIDHKLQLFGTKIKSCGKDSEAA